MKLAALVTAAAILAAPAAQAAPPGATPEAPIAFFLGKLKSGPASEAFKAIWAGTLAERKPGDMQVAADQMDSAIRYFGPVIDWEEIGVGQTSAHFQERYYLVRGRGGPLFFKFHVYDSGAGWMVTKFVFYDDFDKLAVPAVIRKTAP